MLTTYKELQRRVQQRILNDDTLTSDSVNNFLPKCKVWVNERYDRVMRSKPWRELTEKVSLQLTASQRAYGLNRDIGRLITVFDQTNGVPIKEIDVARYIRQRASTLDVASNVQTGDPTHFYQVGKKTVKASVGASAETMRIVSTSSSDVSPLQVHVKGLSSSVELTESITLTGTTAVSGSTSWDANQELQITIGTSDGTSPELTGAVTVDGTTSGTDFTVIAPGEIATEYLWIEVSPLPKASGTQPTWDFWYSKRIQPLKNDNDVPLIDCSQEIIQGVYSDALREDGQPQEAQLEEQKFVILVDELWASRQNTDSIEQFIPQGDGHILGDFGRLIQVE